MSTVYIELFIFILLLSLCGIYFRLNTGTFSLFLKEVRGFFGSLVGYIAIGVFLAVNGLFLWVIDSDSSGGYNILDNSESSLAALFDLAPKLYLLLIPAITMRSFSEEKSRGTIELLLTRPISEMGIVFSKYLAGTVIVLISLLPTLLYYYSVYLLGYPKGNIDSGAFWGSYFGLFFLGCSFVAIGVFASSLASSQVIAFILALIFSFFAYFGFLFMGNSGLFGDLDLIIQSMGMDYHFKSMSIGVIDTRDIIYFVSLILIFLFFTRLVLLSRKKERMPYHTGITLLVSILMLLLNFISSLEFKRFDLTAEKRYTLKPVTTSMLDSLKDVVYFKIYLGGDLNANFTRLKNTTREMLDEFRALSGNKIEYSFINPSEKENSEEGMELQKQLMKSGIEPYTLNYKTGEAVKTKRIWPAAIATYGDNKKTVCNLYRYQAATSEEVSVNNAIIDLEYNLANSIRKLLKKKRQTVAFIEGHGEADTLATSDIAYALSEYYNVVRVNLGGRFMSLDGVDAIVVAQPDTAFSDKDKYIIDQFVVKGGKALWCMDQIDRNKDSFNLNGFSLAIVQDYNLNDYFFKHGVRFGTALVQDLNCGDVKLNMAPVGSAPRFKNFKWIYKLVPVPLETDTHIIVRNLGYVKMDYAGSIDTAISAPGIKKTVLLKSSRYSRLEQTPARISLGIVNYPPNPKMFRKTPYLPLAVLLEGKFSSIFTNHIPRSIDSLTKFKPYCDKPNKMIVISDGDILQNVFRPQQNVFFQCGYDRDMGELFANKSFIINCMNYLLDDEGIMALRNKNVKLRLLNKSIVEQQYTKWSMINLIGPLAFLAAIGLIQFFLRRAKYAK
jgi:ABC-2 type transport system permease protein